MTQAAIRDAMREAFLVGMVAQACGHAARENPYAGTIWQREWLRGFHAGGKAGAAAG